MLLSDHGLSAGELVGVLRSALALLVLGILADDHDLAMALDNLALLAHGLDGRPDFHLKFLLFAGGLPPHLDLHVIRPRARS